MAAKEVFNRNFLQSLHNATLTQSVWKYFWKRIIDNCNSISHTIWSKIVVTPCWCCCCHRK